MYSLQEWPHLMLVLARVGGTLAGAPLFGSRLLPVSLRTAIALIFSFCFAPLVPSVSAGEGFVVVAACETAVGLAMGWTASLALSAAQMGGAIIDQELGLSMATTLDPATGEPVSIIAQFKLLLAGTVYVLVDGHHLLISALLESYRAIPIGGWNPGTGATEMVASLGVGLFGGALKVATPALATAFAVTVATAFLARAMPETSMFVQALPLRLGIGLLVLAGGLAAFSWGFAASVRAGEGTGRVMVDWMGGRS